MDKGNQRKWSKIYQTAGDVLLCRGVDASWLVAGLQRSRFARRYQMAFGGLLDIMTYLYGVASGFYQKSGARQEFLLY